MESSPGDVTSLLHAWSSGDPTAEQRLFALVLPNLHKLARQIMSSERDGHSLQPTALINEVYFRLVSAKDRDWENRGHFFAIAARAMRRLLIDYARARPKGATVPIEELEVLLRGRDPQLELGVVIHTLLDEMETAHPEWSAVIDLKFFAGFSDEEAASALGIPLRTMQRRFGDARRWLYERMEHENCRTSPATTS